jgi:hypothetical protein
MPKESTGRPNGRPPLKDPRRNAVRAKLTDREAAWVARQARKAKVPVGIWVRERVMAGSGVYQREGVVSG